MLGYHDQLTVSFDSLIFNRSILSSTLGFFSVQTRAYLPPPLTLLSYQKHPNHTCRCFHHYRYFSGHGDVQTMYACTSFKGREVFYVDDINLKDCMVHFCHRFTIYGDFNMRMITTLDFKTVHHGF